MAKALSIIIPSRNEVNNLIWTLQAIQCELLGVDYEVLVVLNKCDPADKKRLDKYWPFKQGRMKALVYDDKPSCWQARNHGAQHATGEVLMFLDSHVCSQQNSLSEALAYKQTYQGILALAVSYWLDDPQVTLHQYKWRPDKFWGDWTRVKPQPPSYEILMSGMNLLIDRRVFEAVGGFHPALGIYGGGEPYLYLLVQRYGYSTRCHPDFKVYHLTEKRGYSWNQDDLWRNFMVAAWAVGGAAALEPLHATYEAKCGDVEKYQQRLEVLGRQAVNLAEQARQRINREATYSFEEVIARAEHG